MDRIAAVILAAGKGGRMGRPKLFLKMGRVPFWSLMSRRLRQAGISDIAVVVRRSQRGSVAAERLVRTVVNRRPGLGMFSSVQCGLRAMKGFSGYLLCPVDHPGVEVPTYKSLCEGFSRRRNAIVRPLHRGQPGHPIIVPEMLAIQIRNSSPYNRLDHLIKNGQQMLYNIKVKDKNTIININTERELSFAREYNRTYPRGRKG